MPSYKLTFMILFMSDIAAFALFGCKFHTLTIDRVEGIDSGNSSRTSKPHCHEDNPANWSQKQQYGAANCQVRHNSHRIHKRQVHGNDHLYSWFQGVSSVHPSSWQNHVQAWRLDRCCMQTAFHRPLKGQLNFTWWTSTRSPAGRRVLKSTSRVIMEKVSWDIINQHFTRIVRNPREKFARGVGPGTSLGTRPMVWFWDYVRLIIHRTREETKYVESNDEWEV